MNRIMIIGMGRNERPSLIKERHLPTEHNFTLSFSSFLSIDVVSVSWGHKSIKKILVCSAIETES